MTEQTPQESMLEGAAATESMPQEIPPGEEAAMAQAGMAAPSVPPPGVEEAVGEAFGGAWHSGKKITALWSINQNRNSWIGVPGLGWKKLANNSDSGVVALTMLAAHAKLTGGNVSLKEDGGQIVEMYAY